MTSRQLAHAFTSFALVLAGSAVRAQGTAAPGQACVVPPRPAQAEISSAQYQLALPCVDSLRTALLAEDYDKALRIFFGKTYNPKMANWVVFIEGNGTVRQAVVQNGRKEHLLRGEKYIYATVFLDRPPVRASSSTPEGSSPGMSFGMPTGTDGPGLELSRRSMDYSKEPFTTFMVNSFGAGRLQGGNEPARTVVDLDRPVRLRRISVDSTHTLWFGSARLEVGENTDVQFSLNAVGADQLPGSLTRVTTTINNAKPARLEFGLTIGSSLGPKIESDGEFGTTVQAGAQSNVFISTYVNLVRHHLPRVHRSFGLVAGTNILRGNLLDEILTGVGFGRLLSDAGAVVGVVWQQVHTTIMDPETQRSRTETSRVPRLFLGFDLRM